jgi:hypothetical protein
LLRERSLKGLILKKKKPHTHTQKKEKKRKKERKKTIYSQLKTINTNKNMQMLNYDKNITE